MHKTHTRILAAVTALLIPCTTFAAVMLDVSDSVAGIGLTVDMHGAKVGERFDITATDPDGSTVRIPVQAGSDGSAVAMIPGSETQTAGMYSVRAMRNGNIIGSPVQVEIHPDSVDAGMSQITSYASHIAADGRDQATVEVTLRDRFGNALSGRPVSLIASRKSDRVTALSPNTDVTGTQQFSVRTTENGIIQLRAIDLLGAVTLDASAELQAGSAVGGNAYTASTIPTDANRTFYFNAQAAATFDVIDRFIVTPDSNRIAVGEGGSISVTAVDQNGNQVRDYKGTIIFRPDDETAIYPNFGSYTFKAIDQGKRKFYQELMYQTEGEKMLRVEDINDPSIFGETTLTVGEGSTGNQGGIISIASFADGDYVNTLEIVIAGMAPALSDLVVLGGTEDVRGSSDERGTFSIPITLSAGKRDYTIRVQDYTGGSDSGPLDLILDQELPVIDLVQFAPEKPEEGEKVLVVVQSEPALAETMLNIPDRVNGKANAIKLLENPSEPGTYQGFFTAPAPDVYQAMISATDKAGNVTELSAQFTVNGKTLPTVMNLKAEPKIDAIDLTWDPAAGNLNGYRIYIGDSSDNYLYTLDTGKVTTRATVKGLTQGQEYTFAVTALNNDMESEQKSAPVRARVLGFKLEVTPGDGALRVEWTSLSSDLPLSSFMLEYGTSETEMTESRSLNGDLRDTTIRDLLNGVPYFLRVTPITITGDKLDELSAKGEGTPDGSGFKAGARDDVPFDIGNLPEGPLHSGAPQNPSSGIPAAAWMTLTAVAAAGVTLRWRHRMKVQQTAAFLQAIQSQYRV